MFDLDISADVKGLTRHLNSLQKKQIPFAISQALNDTAFQAKKDQVIQLTKKLDRPTPFTKKGTRVKKANKRNPIATVYIEDNRNEYMKYQVAGGVRKPRNKTILVPTKNLKLNKYGNITRAQRRKLFNDKTRHFTGIPKGMAGAKAGVWKRLGAGGRKSIVMVAEFKKQVSYEKKYPFHQQVNRIAARNFPVNFRNRLDQALKTAR
jgi:hypothetical protein